jgi:hypothetical protein
VVVQDGTLAAMHNIGAYLVVVRKRFLRLVSVENFLIARAVGAAYVPTFRDMSEETIAESWLPCELFNFS